MTATITMPRPIASISDLMRANEEAEGRTIVLPGSVPWFPLRDWGIGDVVARQGLEVHIVAVSANRPGTGSFRRMIDGIQAAGLIPVVVAPFPAMQAILTRWGWRETVKGNGSERREEWRP